MFDCVQLIIDNSIDDCAHAPIDVRVPVGVEADSIVTASMVASLMAMPCASNIPAALKTASAENGITAVRLSNALRCITPVIKAALFPPRSIRSAQMLSRQGTRWPYAHALVVAELHVGARWPFVPAPAQVNTDTRRYHHDGNRAQYHHTSGRHGAARGRGCG